MKIHFYKYQGTGNDFVIIDDREKDFPVDNESLIRQICDRRFGIGADGFILLQEKPAYDFEMKYFNADGREGSMCGNGGRCTVAFARKLGIKKSGYHFWAIDGPHRAIIKKDGWVELKMQNVERVEKGEGYYFMDTGSPHHIVFTENVDEVNVVQQGRKIRYSERYKEQGTNVNFVELKTEGIRVVTYERGVEDETLSCGTGVTAAAVAYALQRKFQEPAEVEITAKGGDLSVRLQPSQKGFKNIWLCGPAEFVFEGVFSWSSNG